jgi:hypothetical protein
MNEPNPSPMPKSTIFAPTNVSIANTALGVVAKNDLIPLVFVLFQVN